MLKFFLRMAAWLLRRQPPATGPAADPYAGVRAPKGRAPAGRTAAVAVAEPEPSGSVDALGRAFRKRQ